MGRLYFGNAAIAKRHLKPIYYKGYEIEIAREYKRYGDGIQRFTGYDTLIRKDGKHDLYDPETEDETKQGVIKEVKKYIDRILIPRDKK